MVIFGHVIEEYLQGNDLYKWIYLFIYTFHMPLFAFISGYFSKSQDRNKLNKNVLKLFETFLIIQIAWFILPGIINNTFSPIDLITPYWTLWYLVSLCCWKLLSFLFVSRLSKVQFFVLSVFLSFAIGFIPDGSAIFAISRTLVFFPFFLVGVYSTEKDIISIRSKAKWSSFVFLFFVLIACYFSISRFNSMQKLLYGSYPYIYIGNAFLASFMRIMTLLLAFAMIYCFVNIIPDIKGMHTKGKNVLLYYIYHGPLLVLIHKAMEYYNISPEPFYMVIAVLCLLFFIITIFARFEIFRILLNPFSYFFPLFSKVDKR